MADHDHEHGSMDIETQENMFGRFISFMVWGVAIIAVALILLYLING